MTKPLPEKKVLLTVTPQQHKELKVFATQLGQPLGLYASAIVKAALARARDEFEPLADRINTLLAEHNLTSDTAEDNCYFTPYATPLGVVVQQYDEIPDEMSWCFTSYEEAEAGIREFLEATQPED